MQIIDVVQGTEEWYRCRIGIPTASEFDKVLQEPGPRGGKPVGRITYMYKLAGEIMTGEPATSFTNWAMERGKVQEPEARADYEFTIDEEVKQVGFVRNGIAGCSPDGLVGTQGLVEIKTAEAHILIAAREAGVFPSAHVAQCQGQMWLCEREWCDLVIYCRRMTLFKMRLKRDELYIARLKEATARFVYELNQLVERQRSY